MFAVIYSHGDACLKVRFAHPWVLRHALFTGTHTECHQWAQTHVDDDAYLATI